MPRQQPEPSSGNTCQATRSTNSTDQRYLPKVNEIHDKFLTPTEAEVKTRTGEGGSPAATTGTKIRSFQSAENGAAASGVPAPGSSPSPAGVDIRGAVVGLGVEVTEQSSG